MKIAIITDAWYPQVNGVVRTYENVSRELVNIDHEVIMITPAEFRTVPCPTYPSIRLSIYPGPFLHRRMDELRPDAIHIATEGPLGHAARRYCLRRNLPFTTSFHTQFPEYIRMRIPFPLRWMYGYLRHFHGAACRTLVPTASQRQRLIDWDFPNVMQWSRGVDIRIFKPDDKKFLEMKRPIFINAGRVAVEKNIEAFLQLDLPGSKIVVGDGPDLNKLRNRYPDVVFTGFKFGSEFARYLAAADVFVFPSVTDTYGLVMLEAMACGLPVAAFPVTGPIDVVENGTTGVLSEDLRHAALAALALDRRNCIGFARSRSWRQCAEEFVSCLQPIAAASAGYARQ